MDKIYVVTSISVDKSVFDKNKTLDDGTCVLVFDTSSPVLWDDSFQSAVIGLRKEACLLWDDASCGGCCDRYLFAVIESVPSGISHKKRQERWYQYNEHSKIFNRISKPKQFQHVVRFTFR